MTPDASSDAVAQLRLRYKLTANVADHYCALLVEGSQEDRPIGEGQALAEQGVESKNEPSGGGRAAARELPIARVDETGVVAAACNQSDLERAIVAHVLGHEHSLFRLGGGEHLFIRRADERRIGGLVDRDGVVSAHAQLERDRRAVHLVEE